MTLVATPRETIDQVFRPIQQFTRGWMLSSATSDYGVGELGMRSGNDFWIVGRAGVMGDCSADVAFAELAFHGPDDVYGAWANIPDELTPSIVAEHYVGRVGSWGEEALTEFDRDRLEVIDTLGRRIANAAPAALGGVFAGWRARPQPKTVEGRVAMTTQVLREMRGAAHINAILSCGLTPLDAILASTNAPPRTGPSYAESMGWKGPFRDPDEVRSARLEAEALTARILEPYFSVLSGRELASFGEVVETTRDAIDM